MTARAQRVQVACRPAPWLPHLVEVVLPEQTDISAAERAQVHQLVLGRAVTITNVRLGGAEVRHNRTPRRSPARRGRAEQDGQRTVRRDMAASAEGTANEKSTMTEPATVEIGIRTTDGFGHRPSQNATPPEGGDVYRNDPSQDETSPWDYLMLRSRAGRRSGRF